MMDYIQILSAILGSFGFGIVFKMKRRRLIFACIGGGITWTIYLVCQNYGMSSFISNFIATFFASAFAKAIASRIKTPEIIYIITSAVPLIPGSSLYYTLNAFLNRNIDLAQHHATTTGIVSAAIAFGILLFTILYNVTARTILHLKNQQKK
ncbi:MAG: threonine/serine exporter family protein [Treponema sp.]|nr:threonine/serine exporter family protein [Candidatus Treponema equifaecale]